MALVEKRSKETDINLNIQHLNVIEKDFHNDKSDKKDDEQSLIEKLEQFYSHFDKEREKWNAIIADLSQKFKNIDKMIEVQVELYSYRQLLLEDKIFLTNVLNRIQRKFKMMKVKTYRDSREKENLYIKNKEDLKIITDDKEKLMVEKLKLYENQIGFLEETLQNMDRMVFGIKHRLQLYEIINK